MMTVVPKFVPLKFEEYAEDEMLRRSREFHAEMESRRSVREFADRPVAEEILRNAIKAAGTAPSGANKQPWTFILVGDPEAKSRIRHAAEAEEKQSYERRMPKEWLEALAPLGTDWRKPFLTICPWLIVVMAQTYSATPRGLAKHSSGIGRYRDRVSSARCTTWLATLTHTPSPMVPAEIPPPRGRRVFPAAAGLSAPGCRVPTRTQIARSDLGGPLTPNSPLIPWVRRRIARLRQT
jgi:hypothetical protein